MRSFRFIFLFILLAFARSATAQQATASAPQAAPLLQQSLSALSGGRPLTDVTLSGTARRIAGSDDESGTVVFKALAGTGSRIDFLLPSGPRSELRNISAVPRVGSWSGPDSLSYPISNHNLFTDPGWFPAFTVAGFVSAPDALITYVGLETRYGQSVVHLTASKQFTQFPTDIGSLMQHLTQTDLYLDSTTLLPAAIAFCIHPDADAGMDIPSEIRFSDYRSMNGTQIPFHVQKFINNNLFLDLQFDSAVVNSNLSATTFTFGAGL